MKKSLIYIGAHNSSNRNEVFLAKKRRKQKMTDYNSKQELDSIDVIFEDMFPKDFKNNVAHWGNFSKEELHQTLPDGTQRLLHMDIDLGNYCSLQCAHCFRRDDRSDSEGDDGFFQEEELLGYLSQAKQLGLQSVKFLGRGEPFQNKNFIPFLEQLKKMDINASVFTKGHVIGSDRLAKVYNSHLGINSGQALADKLKELDVSILLGFNSFDKELQEHYVGLKNIGKESYVKLRDQALKRLVQAGLNAYVPGEPTRLALVAAPIKPENVEEIIDIYMWARKRNIYPVSCPSNVAGKGLDEIERVKHFQDYLPQLQQMYMDIYVWNIEKGIQTAEQLEEEGVSLYPGCHPCTQTAAGMYLMLSGKVVRCPGRIDAQSTFAEDIRDEESLKEVWVKSENYRRAEGKIRSPEGNGLNYRCPARDGRNLSPSLYKTVKEQVLRQVRNKP